MHRSKSRVLLWLISASLLTLSPVSLGAEVKQIEYEISVDGIACPFCAYGIEKQLDKLGGIIEMETDIAAGVIRVSAEESSILTEDQVRAAVEKAGFSLREFRTGSVN